MTSVTHRLQQQKRGYSQRVHSAHPQILEEYTDAELYARSRFGADDIAFIVSLLQPQLEHTTKISFALTVEEQVLIALRFYACGSFYQVIGDGVCVQKATVGTVLHRVYSALASLLNQYVKFPTNPEDIEQIKFKFYETGRMPNTIGVIDCTHVHIKAHCEKEWEFMNRKGHSINVQLGECRPHHNPLCDEMVRVSP